MVDPLRAPESDEHDPYKVEAWIAQLPAAEQAAVRTAALEARDHESFDEWKEHHAFGIALGRPLDEFGPGPFAYYVYGGDDPDDTGALPEKLPPPDLTELALAAGIDESEIDEMEDDELQDAIKAELGERFLDEDSDGFLKMAAAPTLHALLKTLLEGDLLGVDIAGEPKPSDALLTDEALDEMSLVPGGLEPFKAIKDLRLRRMALALQGADQSLEMTDDYDEVFYCRGILARRPGWAFVCGWDVAPPLHDFGLCILRRRPAAA